MIFLYLLKIMKPLFFVRNYFRLVVLLTKNQEFINTQTFSGAYLVLKVLLKDIVLYLYFPKLHKYRK